MLSYNHIFMDNLYKYFKEYRYFFLKFCIVNLMVRINDKHQISEIFIDFFVLWYLM